MLVIREYKESETQDIKKFLISEHIRDLEINGMIFIMIEDKDIIGVCKMEMRNYGGNLKYLVIKEDKRKQKLGNGLLRGILNKLDNQDIEKVYYRENNSYLIKNGFYLNPEGQLELNVSEFFSGGCKCPGECNEV
jgi:N-acetylglutamate synthase-like GNAT family acetyltransferase